MLSPFVLILTLAPAAAPHNPPAPPLHQRIDALLEAPASFRAHDAGPIDDSEFLRRATLDLVGTIPTSAQARAFLDDKSQSKRSAVIDRLLTSPEHARHLATVVDIMLMERLPDKFVPRAAWMDFLFKQFRDNRPWDETAREILAADDSDPAKSYRAKFFMERASEPHLVTRDISRLFLGSNYQCAQCHDHPLIEEYKQHDYYGIFAFLNRTSQTPAKGKKARAGVSMSEKPDGEVTFQSVFDPKKITRSAVPRVPGGDALPDPKGAKGYSRRARLGGQVARADYEPFRRNVANRLWAHMMGKGLVEPLDQDHPANPPTNPELLSLLSSELAAHSFDVRWFLREIALTRAYQRSSVPRAGVDPKSAPLLSVATLKPLSPEQLASALMEATGFAETQRMSLGKGLTEATLHARLSPSVRPFASAYGAPPGSPEAFDPRMDQALFLANGPTVRSWLSSRSGSLLARLDKLKGDALVDELYLSILSRRPDAEERSEAAAFLAKRPKGAAEFAWALLASTEFRFNH